MDRHDIDAEQLNDGAFGAFLADHVDRRGQLPWAGVMPLLGYLRSAGVAAPETAIGRSPLDGFLGEYRGCRSTVLAGAVSRGTRLPSAVRVELVARRPVALVYGQLFERLVLDPLQ